jgi:hypothetical protein
VVVLLGLLAGCGSRFDGAKITVTASEDPYYPANGNYSFSVQMTTASGKCPLSSSATLAINGKASSFGVCWLDSYANPFTGNPSFTLQATDGDDHAEMIVDDLVPGADAMAAGSVPVGGDLMVSLPSAFEGVSVREAQFLNNDPADSYYAATTSPTYVDVLAGAPGVLEVPAPQHPATYTLLVWMDAHPSGHLAECTGFSQCDSVALSFLGPFTVTVTP